MTDEQIPFLPFNAINEYMRDDFRLQVIRAALQALPELPGEQRARIDQLTRLFVQAPGFRNSAKAPVPIKAKAMVAPFEKHPELVAFILTAWADSRPELRQQVHDLLTSREWEMLPPDADRTQLPGFYPTWPADEDFDVLNDAFAEQYPDSDATTDDVSLMVVWLSLRLPYNVEEDDDYDEDEEEYEEGEEE